MPVTAYVGSLVVVEVSPSKGVVSDVVLDLKGVIVVRSLVPLVDLIGLCVFDVSSGSLWASVIGCFVLEGRAHSSESMMCPVGML